MSKAFKGEDASETPLVVPPRAPLPVGQPNYVTPRGLAALKIERERLQRERAQLVAADPSADGIRQIASLVLRLSALDERLAQAHLVHSAQQPHDEVRFGATVRARDPGGRERGWTIVGVDEADPAAGRIAFVAPLAHALLGRGVGDIVKVRTPHGAEDWEVIAIDYESE